MGFCDELQAEVGNPDIPEVSTKVEKLDKAIPSKECKGWLMLEGSIGGNGKPIATIGVAQLKVLRAARQEVKWEFTFCLYSTNEVHADLAANDICNADIRLFSNSSATLSCPNIGLLLPF